MVDIKTNLLYIMDMFKEPKMIYPAEMTQEEIEQFEYEINKIIDIERDEGQFWAVNAELQIVADLQQQQALEVDGSFV